MVMPISNSTHDIYSAEPAFPILAHSLLNEPDNGTVIPNEPVSGNSSRNDWNLKEHWNKGISNSQSSIFRCGTVIGFSRLRARTKDNDDYIAQVPRHLLIKGLAQSSSQTKAFIIFPTGFEAFAPRTLLNALQSSSIDANLSREEAIKRLDNVQLLPVHNFRHAAQAIGRVSESLEQIEIARQKPETNASAFEPVFLIVVGLDTLAEGIIRASNPVRGTALLAATLRNLNRMSRSYASFLSTFLVNTNGLGPATFELPHQQGPNGPSKQDKNPRSSWDDGVHSIFQTLGSSLLSTLLMKTLDQGIDTHILLSDINTVQVAEVIKCRHGPGLGKWGSWILSF